MTTSARSRTARSRTARFRTARSRYRRWVTREATSGMLLLGSAALGLIWANSPWRGGFTSLSGTTIGPEALHLHLSVSTWASDGLLAVFFFVVGVELTHELVAGSLRNPRTVAVPVLAAVGGMVAPALLYTSVVLLAGQTAALHGWAIPTATDIAFAVAVLAIFGRGLPRALRTFLLTLAVVDDLLAICVIAVFYTDDITLWALGAALVAVLVFAVLVRMRHVRWWLLVPAALVAWGFMHASGVHSTIAGVLLGLSVPARAIHGEREPRTRQFDSAVRPFSAGVALPVFALFSAGVPLVEGGGPSRVLLQPVVPAIVLGLVVGKFVGVLGTTALLTTVMRLRLPGGIGLRDLLPVGLLAGIGFTVSLLIAELSFTDVGHRDGARVAVLLSSLIAAGLAAVALRRDSRRARRRGTDEGARVPGSRTRAEQPHRHAWQKRPRSRGAHPT